MAVDWKKVYRAISTFRVDMPEPVAGEPHNLEHLRDLAHEIHRKRDRASLLFQKLSQRAAALRRKIRIERERIRVARIGLRVSDPDVRKCKSESARIALIDEITIGQTTLLAVFEGRIQDFDGAISALEMQIKGLEQSKQLLNSLSKITFAELYATGELSQPM